MAALDRILPLGFVQGLDKMFMCGNYGDPAANHETLDIYRWVRQQNPNIVLGMNTNGGLQNTQWWQELAQILNQPQDYVVFSIDGLDDTNSMYRVGVDWQRLMSNVNAFITAGGTAHWDMLIYRHNEHQVDICEQMARDMGFRWFRSKVSKRPLIGVLEAPTKWAIAKQQSKIIQCHALNEQSVYIDAQGRVHPCCWLGSRQKNFVTDFDAVQKSWVSETPNPVCVSACGTKNTVTNFDQQWRREIAL